MKWFNFFLILFFSVPAWADDPISISGYLKEIWQYSHSSLDGQPYFLNTDRARLTLDAKKSIFTAHVDYDQEVLAGSYFRTPEYQYFGFGEPSTWLNMDRTIDSTSTSLWRQKIYRGWAGIETDQELLRFGRQRIAWGTGKFWNPTDVLNPFNPLSIEPDERSGVDAAYDRVALGNLSQAEIVYAPKESWPQSAFLTRLKTNWKGYDFSLMGGKTAVSTASWMTGGDFAGNFFNGTLRGEWSYNDPINRSPYWQADGGYDYTFSSDAPGILIKNAVVSLEYFHNGAGSLNSANYNFASVLNGQQVTLAQDYIGGSYSKDMNAVLNFDLLYIENLDDGSKLAWPTLKWNALENLYLSAGFQRFLGRTGSELGHASNLGFLQAQYYF